MPYENYSAGSYMEIVLFKTGLDNTISIGVDITKVIIVLFGFSFTFMVITLINFEANAKRIDNIDDRDFVLEEI